MRREAGRAEHGVGHGAGRGMGHGAGRGMGRGTLRRVFDPPFHLRCSGRQNCVAGHSGAYFPIFRPFLILADTVALISQKSAFFQRFFENKRCGGR